MKEISKILLEKKAVTLNVDEPYTYVSGIRSPIYTDNRVLNYYPDARKTIIEAFVEKLIGEDFDVVAGVATGAISWGAWVAQALDKPFVYVRKKSKGYGQDKRVEGGDITGKKVLVIEDMASTGGSSVRAVEAVRNEGGTVDTLAMIFTYNLKKASANFKEAKLNVICLTDIETVVETASDQDMIAKDKIEMVLDWKEDPPGWGPKNGFPNVEK